MHKIYINGLSGKMGQSLLRLIKSSNKFEYIIEDTFDNCDVVIDFSNPISTLKILKRCLDIKIPIIIGTTGSSDNAFFICQQNFFSSMNSHMCCM